MDITKFNTVSASSKARTLKLKNPFTNETIEEDSQNKNDTNDKKNLNEK